MSYVVYYTYAEGAGVSAGDIGEEEYYCCN